MLTATQTAIQEENDRLKHQIEQLQAVLNNITTGVSLLEPLYDKTGQIVDFRNIVINDYNARRFGKSIQELTDGRGVGELFPGWQETENFAIYRRVFNDEQPRTFDTFYDQFGLRSWLEVEVRRLGVGVLVSFRDITALHESEQKQREQAELLQAVFNNAYVGIAVYEPVLDEEGQVTDFRFQFTNPTAFRLPNLTQENTAGRLSSEIYPDYKERGLFQEHRSVYQTGQPLRLEKYYPEFKIWVDVSITKLGMGIMHTFADITERKQIESQLKYQADTFQAVLGAVTHGLNVFQIIWDETGQLADLRYEFVSDQMLRDTGLSREQVIGNTLITLFPTARQSSYWPAYQAALQTDEPQRFEEFYQYDGYKNYIIGEVCRANHNRLITTYRIINDLKAAQWQAEQQAELIRSVLDGSPNAVIAFDAVRDQAGTLIDLRYVLQNEVNRQRVGRSDEQLLGQTMRSFFPDVVELGLLDGYRRVIETGQPWHWEGAYTYPNRSGWFGYTAVKRGDGMVLTVQDKTLEHEAQQHIEAANRTLIKSNENLQSFAYVASHDLQEPLRKIHSFSNILLQQHATELSTEASEMLQRMQAASDRMSGLIRDILALSRLATQQQTFQPVELENLVHEVLMDLEAVVIDKDAAVDVASLPTVMGDALQLRQLFQNLLSNALKFTQAGRRPQVRVTCELRSPNKVPDNEQLTAIPAHLAAEAVASFWAISVADNGIGFDAKKYGDRVFGTFQRLHGRTSNYSGTGIGLAIVKKVVDNHRGEITVWSREGEGATFTVYLPVS
ncbi:PAS domain-containing sensor histidine kinase [Spirosoma radiotolerans]|uniref:PAS domain-containing sensor histidine kinase n=1 Tax=Spirosoma radiotolerans TaxID=1379870 RepID=UPI000696829F|nr:ATP-binding protein [Spirosoma radiotolerans]